MNRFKAWIKRPVNFNMASLLLVAAILLIFAAICFGFIWAGEEELNSQTVSIGTILISLLNALALGFFVIIPLVISLVIIIFSVVSRIIYSAVNSKRLLAYRIVSGIGYFFMLAGCLLYSSFYFYTGIAAAVFDLLVKAVFVIGVKNTYSEKIKYGGYLHEKKTNEND